MTFCALSSAKGMDIKMENASMLKFHADDIILKEGGTYEEILQYFYEGTEIKEVAEILQDVE